MIVFCRTGDGSDYSAEASADFPPNLRFMVSKVKNEPIYGLPESSLYTDIIIPPEMSDRK